MREAALDAFPAFTRSLEGRTQWIYRDVKGLCTVGCGNLIDPIGLAFGLPWTISGRPAMDAEITNGWNAVKAQPAAMLASAYESASSLRLSDPAIDELVRTKLAQNEVIVRRRFANWDALPADAQLGVMSLAWACGPDFHFPRFAQALLVADFATCAVECQMNANGNPGLVPRNERNAALFVAAETSADPEVLTGWSADA